jgi:ribosome biogenesis protein SSF1/2
VRRLVESKVPNLGRLNDIADYIARSGEGAAGGMMGAGGISDSEAEDEAHQVDMPPSGLTRRRKKKNGDESSTGTGGGGGSKSALKLVELGPRLRLKLYKVERLLSGGDVMYHAYVSKTPAEVAALKKRKDGEASLKKRRREEQEGNVERKKRAKDEKRDAREGRRKEREDRAMAALRGEGGGSVGDDDDGSDDGNSDDGDGEEEDGGSKSGDGDDDDDDDDDASGSEDEGESEGSSRE